MNGNLMYEVVRQRIAEQQRAAQAAREVYAAREAARQRRAEARQRRAEARQQRAEARGRRGGTGAPDSIDIPTIPDFAHEMFTPARDVASEPDTRDRHARSGR